MVLYYNTSFQQLRWWLECTFKVAVGHT